MNVKELIAALSIMPENAIVSHLWDGAPGTKINIVYLAKSGEVVTSDYGMVCYATDDRPTYAPDEIEQPYWETPSIEIVYDE